MRLVFKHSTVAVVIDFISLLLGHLLVWVKTTKASQTTHSKAQGFLMISSRTNIEKAYEGESSISILVNLDM